LFTNAHDAPREVAFARPQTNERGLAFVVKLTLKSGEFGEPFAVFADFGPSGCGNGVESAVELGPIIHRQTVKRLEKQCYSNTRPVTRIAGYC